MAVKQPAPKRLPQYSTVHVKHNLSQSALVNDILLINVENNLFLCTMYLVLTRTRVIQVHTSCLVALFYDCYRSFIDSIYRCWCYESFYSDLGGSDRSCACLYLEYVIVWTLNVPARCAMKSCPFGAHVLPPPAPISSISDHGTPEGVRGMPAEASLDAKAFDFI